jgi:hypothetical protein
MIKTGKNKYRTTKLSNDLSRIVSGSFSVGDYVFASKYSDNDPYDPWCVGLIFEIGIDKKGGFVRIDEGGMRCWRNIKKLTAEQGKEILSALANYR